MFSVLLSEMSAWTDEEVVKLIEIWGEDTIQAQMEGCKHNKEVYTKVSKEMKEAGYERSLEQCTSSMAWGEEEVVVGGGGGCGPDDISPIT